MRNQHIFRIPSIVSSTEFNSLPLSPDFLHNLAELGYASMTPIQAQSLPYLLNKQDLIAKAKTGSGKTVAFGIGLLNKIVVKRYVVQALVLCPTRELADQVAKEIRKLARFTSNVKVLTLCGGMPFAPQLSSLEHPPHIIVGTPGRLQEHLRKGSLSLDNVSTLVLDEADRMLDMGFLPSIMQIIEDTNSDRQTLLFSATYPSSIKRMSADIQRDPIEVSAEVALDDSSIEQLFFETEEDQREAALLSLLSHYQPQSSVIFCNTKRSTQEVADLLQAHGHHALAIHGDLEQKDRDQVLVRFANNSCSILVATDVAARGLDIDNLQAVINFEIGRDPDAYVHRIGRTGRAGKEGLALSLYTADEIYKVSDIELYQKSTAVFGNINSLKSQANFTLTPSMTTLQIDGGRKQKIRPGDILGALTGDAGIEGKHVGKIAIFERWAYVAVAREEATRALKQLGAGKIKGRHFKVRKLR
ncbi:MAG: ATP-dependent RNA helicase DbpA [Pseudomonadales bacterium]